MSTTLKWLALAAKAVGFISMLDLTMFQPKVGVLIFLGASIAKDAVNRIGDYLDDGKANQSWTAAVIATLALSGALLFTGCSSTRLESGGAYAPTDTNGAATVAADLEFYQVDLAYKVAWQSIDTAFVFEKQNRVALWKLSPYIKRALDSIRPQAVEADRLYHVARAAYEANPTPDGLNMLQSVLDKAQQLAATATAVLAQVEAK